MTAHIHDWAGKGIGVNPTGTDYPFVAPGTDMAGLLADLWIEHTGSSIVGPLRITWIRGLDLAFTEEPEDSLIEDSPNHPVDLVIKDANNATVLDTRVVVFAVRRMSNCAAHSFRQRRRSTDDPE